MQALATITNVNLKATLNNWHYLTEENKIKRQSMLKSSPLNPTHTPPRRKNSPHTPKTAPKEA